MSVVPEIHASRLLAKTVLDAKGHKLGRVVEIYVDLASGEELPAVISLGVTGRGSGSPLPKAARDRADRVLCVPWRTVQVLVRQYLSLTVTAGELIKIAPPVPDSRWLPVRRALFDKQIVDLNGLRVVRVNDIKFNEVAHVLRLVAVDIGLRGLLRRLGLRPLVHLLEGVLSLSLPDTLIGWQDVQRIELEGDGRLHLGVPYERLARLRPADLADILEALHTRERTAVLDALTPAVAAETLTEVEPEAREQILSRLKPAQVLSLLESLPADEAAEILSRLRADRAAALLGAMRPEQGEQVRTLLEYDEDTAGRLMSREFVAFAQSQTAEETIRALRQLKPPADSSYYLYVVDEEHRLLGIVSLRDLVVASPDRPLHEIMRTTVVAVHVWDDRQAVGEMLAKYNLLALPVVDEQKRLVGVVSLPKHADELFGGERRRGAIW